MKNEDSIYRLFGDLSSFVKDRGIALSKELPRVCGETPASEHVSFDEAMRDIQRIEHVKKRIRRIRSEQKMAREDYDQERQLAEALSEEYRLNVTNLPEYMEGCIEGINPVTMEKLRSGEYSAQKVLDLHGLRTEEAYEMFQGFIKEAIRSNVRCIKIIHGRGLKSRHEPVLKSRLKEWILRAMHRRWVIAFASSTMRGGGPGATNILLRQQPKKERLHIMG